MDIAVDIDHLRSWIGRTETLHDTVTPAPLQALAATLDRAEPPAAVPACWHWLYFLPAHRQSEIGADGHPKRGGFMPPVPLPRRMWAGSQLEFGAPLQSGQAIERCSRIADVRLKDGRSGPLVFVQVRHEITEAGRVAISEMQDIVYRGDVVAAEPSAAAVPAALPEAPWSRRIVPDDVLLFRYSALTFNGHRIHYDRRYTQDVEHYPGLVVHGPLIATLLLELLHQHRPGATVARFAFKAVKPLFDTAPFTLHGRPQADGRIRLWACTPEGAMAMDAEATLA